MIIFSYNIEIPRNGFWLLSEWFGRWFKGGVNIMAADSIFNGLPDWLVKLQENILWSLGGMVHLMDEEMADQLNLNPRLLRTKLIKALLDDENVLKLARQAYKSNVMTQSNFERYFKLYKTFELKVPDGYIHAEQMARFKKRDRIIMWDDSFTDKEFVNASEELLAGETYRVEMLEIVSQVNNQHAPSMEECFAYLCQRDAILVGVQGASLLLQLFKEKISSKDKDLNRLCISFGKNNVPWLEPEIVPESGLVPVICEPFAVHHAGGQLWKFCYMTEFTFNNRQIYSYYLLLFKKI